ncbi:MAG: histidine kinase [Solobacterium sp.]|nr:histidine kinase [Solobacterium sp.]
MLQHQINPHFINNTLQAMKALSLEGQSEKVSRIATMLGRFLNYAVYEPYQTVALETEVEYVKNYIELQNIRYNDRILFDCNLEEGTQGLMMPKMTLQPMIENCIHHGLGSEGTLTITVSAEIDARGIVVFIYDDGGGISEEKLAEIRENLTINNVYKNNRSIGIVNVNERLYRRFGEAYQMDIRSHTGYGTTIIMKFPLPKEMEENT